MLGAVALLLRAARNVLSFRSIFFVYLRQSFQISISDQIVARMENKDALFILVLPRSTLLLQGRIQKGILGGEVQASLDKVKKQKNPIFL